MKGGDKLSKNLKNQFHYVIECNFREGMDKHSLKKSKSKNDKIFSYSDRRNLIDSSASFSNWMKVYYPNIKMLNQLNSEHIQGYFNYHNNWTDATMKVRYSHLRKLERMAQRTFKIKNSFMSNVILPIGGAAKRTLSITKDELDKLLMVTSNSKSTGRYAVIFATAYGLRCSEIAKLKWRDIQFIEGTYCINIVDSKGKRSRTIKTFNAYQKAFLALLRMQNKDKQLNDRICPISQGALNKYVSRAFEKAGLTRFKGSKTSIHALRKFFANSYYRYLLEQGLTREHAINVTSFYLGHGKNRFELIKRYITEL